MRLYARRFVDRVSLPRSRGPYEYKPLNNEIRVIDLFPGRFDDPIFVKPHHATIDQEHVSTQYDALSYVWGDDKDVTSIRVTDGRHAWSLAVTRHCEVALRFLRLEQQIRTVWVDAICINQADLEERAGQVRLMYLIYSHAARVIVWLGPASEDSGKAMSWIDHVGSRVARKADTFRIYALTDDGALLRLSDDAASPEQCLALDQLLSRLWWQRLWVWQEVRAGGDRVHIVCGRDVVTWQCFLNWIHYFRSRPHIARRYSSDAYYVVNFVNDLLALSFHNTAWILHAMWRCSCKDDRDRIYTANYFGGTDSSVAITPNYTNTVAEVYIDHAITYTKEKNTLELLSYAGMRADNDDTGVRNLPSWVPDWTVKGPVLPIHGNFASGHSGTSTVAASPEGLVVHAKLIGHVHDTVVCGFDDIPASGPTFWEAFSNMLKRMPSAIIKEDFVRRLCHVIGYGVVADHFEPPVSSLPTSREFESFVQSALNPEENAAGIEAQDRCIRTLNYLRGRSILIMDGAHLALGPHVAQPGDVLSILLGLDIPVVLRPVMPVEGSGPARYRFLGPCVCEGFMSGEAVLGPLPSSTRSIRLRDDDLGDHVHALRNEITGTIDTNEPRLPSLTQDWSIAKVRSKSGTIIPGYENMRTGEQRPWYIDPRMDATALMERGVELQVIQLI